MTKVGDEKSEISQGDFEIGESKRELHDLNHATALSISLAIVSAVFCVGEFIRIISYNY